MCRVLVKTVGLSQEEWLSYRKQGIGGSDAGAICGLNPYSSPMSVYIDKTRNDTEPIDNEAMRQGRDLEEYVASRFMQETGLKVRRANCIYQKEDKPFMLANVDRMIVGKNAGLECKIASPYSQDKWKDGNVPAHYIVQCYHYMAVTGAEEWYLAVVILGKEFKYIRIERDEKVILDLIRIEEEFWMNHMLTQTLPSPDGTKASEEVIHAYFSNPREETVIITGFEEKIERRIQLAGLIEKMEKEKKQIEQEVKLAMKDATEADCGAYHIRWKEVSSVRLDTERIKNEKPEIYQQYGKSVLSRRFSIETPRNEERIVA